MASYCCFTFFLLTVKRKDGLWNDHIFYDDMKYDDHQKFESRLLGFMKEFWKSVPLQFIPKKKNRFTNAEVTILRFRKWTIIFQFLLN